MNGDFISSDSASLDATNFDLRDLPPQFYEDPYPIYRRLREQAPVLRLPDGSVFLTRYRDVLAVYKDAQGFSSDKVREFAPKFGDSPLFEHHTTSLVFNDPPLHTRVRRPIISALSIKAIERLKAGLIERVDALLDSMQERSQVDLIEDFAAAIPLEIIGNLFDVPRTERAPLRDWSLAILGALEPSLSEEQLARGNRAVSQMSEYLRGLIVQRRNHPGDPESDVLTRLIEAGMGATQLSEKELVQNCIFILNAGHETTTNLIGNSLHALTRWPDERARLIAEPGLIDSAVEEFLRFESSNQLGNRITTGPCSIGDTVLAVHTRVHLGIGAANRDPEQFPDPERLDLARTPNRHLAFGSGIHQCAGMNLARLEAALAIARFLARFPNYRLGDTCVRGGRARFRGFLKLPCDTGKAHHHRP